MNPQHSSEEDEMNGFINGYHLKENDNPSENDLEKSNQSFKKENTWVLGDGFFFYIIFALFFSTLLTFSIFLILLIFKIEGNLQWSYMKISSFFDAALLSFFCLTNIMIAKNSNHFGNCLGKCFLSFCLNGLFIMLFLLGILLSVKLDTDLNWEFSIVFIPFYMIMGLFFAFLCFSFPGLIDPSVKMYKEAILSLLHSFSFIVTLVLVLLKLDGKLKLIYSNIFIVEEIAFLAHFIVVLKFRPKDESKFHILKSFLFASLLCAAFICFGLKCDDLIGVDWKITLIPFYLIYIVIIIESIRIFLHWSSIKKS